MCLGPGEKTICWALAIDCLLSMLTEGLLMLWARCGGAVLTQINPRIALEEDLRAEERDCEP